MQRQLGFASLADPQFLEILKNPVLFVYTVENLRRDLEEFIKKVEGKKEKSIEDIKKEVMEELSKRETYIKEQLGLSSLKEVEDEIGGFEI